MEALVNAGGKGTRMGACGIEKPMQIIGGKPVVQRVVEAIGASAGISRVVVSVSEHTLATERFLRELGVETVRTSGEDFMDDLHEAFRCLSGKYVFTSPSDMPLLTTAAVDRTLAAFDPAAMESMIVLVDADVVMGMGVTPSFTREIDGKEWVLSGLSVMDRERTLAGEYLQESCLQTDWNEVAVNVNTPAELALARLLF